MDWLKEIMGEALTDEMMEKVKKEIPKHFVIKSDFNKRGDDIKDLTDQLEKANASMKELSAKADASDEIKAKLETLTTEYDDYKKGADQREKNYKVKGQLEKVLAKHFNPDAVEYLANSFKLEELTLNEAGEIVDIDAKVTRLAEAKPGLKLTTVANTQTPPGDKQTKTEVDYDSMSDAEYYAAKRAESANKEG